MADTLKEHAKLAMDFAGRDIILGIAGAGRGAIFQTLSFAGVTGVNLGSMLVAVIGAVVVLVVHH